ncbi:hypothetical protein [Rathayibacter sp. VKM Ac-2760]|uniref:hypothetical protein n=1 Tax=Rathayibacter sp. VKM Ac-2760 TaxID=2609253 RepID=UPI001319AD6B|nr:hypothetical protein [Rathayibacter sp. VKM Ac-2760]QHC60989.1 hypothetical protein GSU72_19890 [Rathayibacter sp. VKM Ac-2760]
MTSAASGWVVYDASTPLLPAFWLDGFPVATPDEPDSKGSGAADRVSPIYEAYDKNGGIGAIQYVNVTHNTAALVLPNQEWKTGGEFELWISPGAGQMPYRLPFKEPRMLARDSQNTWESLLGNAMNEAQLLIGYDV